MPHLPMDEGRKRVLLIAAAILRVHDEHGSDEQDQRSHRIDCEVGDSGPDLAD
jgi:hypothetical protein